jgi:CBS domain containing-hemolysin-like protein
VDTIGGLAASALGKIPAVGEEVVVEGMRIRVEKMAQNRVAEVIIQLSPEQSTRLEQVLNE